jgi:hypothetical protein
MTRTASIALALCALACNAPAGGPDGGPQADASGADGSNGLDSGTGPDGAIEGDGSIAGGDADLDAFLVVVPPDPRDVVRPRVTIEQGAAQTDPTSIAVIAFDVVFDEPMDVRTLSATDFAVRIAGDRPIPVLTALADSGDHRTFELRLSGLPDVDQRYEVELPDSAATDWSGNPNEPSTSEDNRVYYDVVRPTVEVRKYIPVETVTNLLPITFQVVFQSPVDPTTFSIAEITNGGTATGVVWETFAPGPAGSIYLVQATAVETPGTIFPAVAEGAATDLTGAPNHASVYVGIPVTYTTLPILEIHDARASEGELMAFTVSFRGALTSTTPTTFDWATIDGTAIAGTDYVAAGAMGVTIPAGGSSTALRVSPSPEDTLPEPHRQFEVRLSGLTGAVHLVRDVATGTVLNDDSGTASTGGTTGPSELSGPEDIRLEAERLYTYGAAEYDNALLQTRQLDGTVRTSLSFGFGSDDPGGLATSPLGLWVGRNVLEDGYHLQMLEHGGGVHSAFGSFGDVHVVDATDVLSVVDVAVSGTDLYATGTRVDPGGNASWWIARREAETGALAAAFGTAGVVEVDRATGSIEEASITMRLDGGSLYVLVREGAAYRIERRSAIDGSLVAAFGTAGVLVLGAPYVGVADFDALGGTLYVVGAGSGETVVSEVDGSDGSMGWQWTTVMDDPRVIHASASGLFFGGSRGGAMHLERWRIDGSPVWARTFEYGLASAVTGIVMQEGTDWVHSVAYETDAAGERNWYYDRRHVPDGFTYTNGQGAPLE